MPLFHQVNRMNPSWQWSTLQNRKSSLIFQIHINTDNIIIPYVKQCLYANIPCFAYCVKFKYTFKTLYKEKRLLAYSSIYSGTPLIRPPMGQNKVVVLTGWSYYRGRVIFRSKHVLIKVYCKHIRASHVLKLFWSL